MRKSVSLLVLLVWAVGCGSVPQIGSDNLTSSTNKEDFEGWYLTVWVDGTQTTNKDGEKTPDENLLWRGPATVGGNPEIKFTMDKEHLGDFKSLEIVINPYSGNTIERTKFYKPGDAEQMQPQTPFKLGSTKKFQFFDNKGLQELAALPAGTYYLHLTVHGSKTWDRQTIAITVK